MTLHRQCVAAAAVALVLRAYEVWVRRRRDLCVELCWQLLIIHFGLACLLVRTVLLARRECFAARTPGRAHRAGTWWTRLGLDDATEMALDALGLPGALVHYAAVATAGLVTRLRR
ncbi:hypothetical protein FHS29_004771 [Saccharothrix tamanrassetensis]|uniref:Uncharacterized protein n=1 Tax=Saccharothrix tamanrassetensis TaxID=1051531 RepID=A0A841CMK7_9PSEU|nr:hypothetical protein [Saccharothrix tamanrassetensis]MBB5958163.1 hypothetical protein [Saccharothrix tamanrassetensis]